MNVKDLDDVTIRLANRGDANAIARVHVASWQGAYAGILPDEYLSTLDPTNREASWATALSDPEQQTWIAQVTGQTIGFASLGPCRDEDAEPEDLEVYTIYLDPEVTGRGIGRNLMRTILSDVPPQARISMWVLADNTRAHHFYRRHGFQPDGVERREDFGGRDLTVWRLRRA